MLKNFIVVLITFAFGWFLYGARYIFLEVEENACRMTYMFGEPQFLKLKFKENKEFPHYGLYYYYEGPVQQNIKYLTLRGAPVLFVPGNAGSFKQVRSLASVALQKALDNEHNIQLNYFAIDFKEQLSGFYGGYLEDQKMFLKLCIQVVSNIYEKKKSVIIIGHSMGGKVAQAVLEQRGDFTKINSIIFISSPLDIPVINLDYEIQKFYVNNEKFLSINRERYLAHNETNTCVDLYQNVSYFRSQSSFMENILMISIGGGKRDLMVQESLTISKYSDIHAMTSSIPKVWLSCDHLSSVWCLQLVKVINRFIFAVATVDSRNDVFYLDEKGLRVQAAMNYFVKPLNRHKVIELYFNSNYKSVWDEQSKIVYGKLFKNGLRHYYNQLLTIQKYKDYKKFFMEVTGLDENNWLFACLETFHEGNSLGCNKGIPISHYIQNIPAQDTFRSVSLIDVEHVLKYYPNWTHIMIRLPPTNKKVSFKIDIYKANERKIILKAPRFSFDRKVLITETTHATMHYMILIQDLEEPISTLRFDIEPIACVDKPFQITGKICVPWVRGFERYKHLSHNTLDKSIYVNVPIPTPTGYNTSVNPVCLELFLDPPCRYKIRIQETRGLSNPTLHFFNINLFI
ncbi:GPI inositol-deacylase isoform 2-T2 [Glossina fuscipes fuscipes]